MPIRSYGSESTYSYDTSRSPPPEQRYREHITTFTDNHYDSHEDDDDYNSIYGEKNLYPSNYSTRGGQSYRTNSHLNNRRPAKVPHTVSHFEDDDQYYAREAYPVRQYGMQSRHCDREDSAGEYGFDAPTPDELEQRDQDYGYGTQVRGFIPPRHSSRSRGYKSHQEQPPRERQPTKAHYTPRISARLQEPRQRNLEPPRHKTRSQHGVEVACDDFHSYEKGMNSKSVAPHVQRVIQEFNATCATVGEWIINRADECNDDPFKEERKVFYNWKLVSENIDGTEYCWAGLWGGFPKEFILNDTSRATALAYGRRYRCPDEAVLDLWEKVQVVFPKRSARKTAY